MRIAMSGSTGMVGRTVVPFLTEQGHAVSRIVRPQSKGSFAEPTIAWDPGAGSIDAQKLEGQDVIIHLAGANIAGNRWTAGYKKILADSRVKSTELLCRTIIEMKTPPQVLLSASAIGFYGNHPPETIIDETAVRGHGFLSDICYDWEMATRQVENEGIRVVNMRIGVVLGLAGGALAKMLPIFKLGLGGPLGDGRQMMSWIALAELPHLMSHLIVEKDLHGPVNLVAPQPVSNAEFTKTLGRVLKRPAVFPVPAFGVKTLFGEMGDTLLLGGAKVLPQSLLDSEYSFKYPDLQSALETLLN